jgi:hypothetical protein
MSSDLCCMRVRSARTAAGTVTVHPSLSHQRSFDRFCAAADALLLSRVSVSLGKNIVAVRHPRLAWFWCSPTWVHCHMAFFPGRAIFFGQIGHGLLTNKGVETAEDVALGCCRADVERKGSRKDTRRDGGDDGSNCRRRIVHDVKRQQ